MEKFSIEIEARARWINYRNILRPTEVQAESILVELKEKNPTATINSNGIKNIFYIKG